jgi:threonine dehydrogenase-like Zn-dependent dehydrogenase
MLQDTLRKNMDHAVAFWSTAPGAGQLRPQPLPAPVAGEVIVQTLFSGVSRGTESLVFNGQVPASEWPRMRAPFQAGDFPFPVKYGYASVGRVVGGDGALLGQHVFCLHPHQTRYVVPASAVHQLPADVPASRAVLAANLETALNAVWDADLRAGDEVRVVGGGSIGLLTAWLATQLPGCNVQLIDTNPHRAAIARALGVAFALPDNAQGNADAVLHASGSEAGLQLCLQLAGFEACITELSWYGDRAPAVPLGGAFHSQRLTLRASQVGSVATVQRPRWTHARRLQLALSLLRDSRLDALLNSEGQFQHLPTDMPRLAQADSGVIMHRVIYD